MKQFSDLVFNPHPSMEGVQALHFFDNGYGISVIRFKLPHRDGYGSYTDNENEWEAAVLVGNKDDCSISYNTDITGDVIGHLSSDEVTQLMIKIQNLKS